MNTNRELRVKAFLDECHMFDRKSSHWLFDRELVWQEINNRAQTEQTEYIWDLIPYTTIDKQPLIDVYLFSRPWKMQGQCLHCKKVDRNINLWFCFVDKHDNMSIELGTMLSEQCRQVPRDALVFCNGLCRYDFFKHNQFLRNQCPRMRLFGKS